MGILKSLVKSIGKTNKRRYRNSRRQTLQLELLEPRQMLAGLLGQSDFDFLGAFRVPQGQYQQSTFAYGGTAPAFNPANNSLFLVGHDWDQAVAEISIPQLVISNDINQLRTASIIQPFSSIQSRIPNWTHNYISKIGGLEVVGNQLVGTFFEYYDADFSAIDSHFTLSTTNLATADVDGLFQVGNLGGGYVGGYMTPIPVEWQDELGMPYLTGQAALAIAGRTSAGPAAFGFDPNDLGGTTAPTITYVNYPLDHPLAPVSSTNPLYNLTSEITGVVFPENSSSVIFFGSHGTGEYCYGVCDDPAREGSGVHGYPYEYQAWAYDVHDFIDVKNGIKESWEIQPYDVWNFDLPFDDDAKHIGGVTYDSATGRLYIAQQNADYAGAPYPVINVFQLPTDSSNQAPNIDNQWFAIDENSPNGSVVGQVVATDPEGSPLTFAILAGNTNNAFVIDSNSGEIRVNNSSALDYEFQTSFALTVQVADPQGLNDSATVTINLNDINEQGPTISNVLSTNVTEDSALIQWTTDVPADSRVEYGLTSNFGDSTDLDSTLVTNHSVPLTGLQAGSLYYFRVISQDVDGNESASPTNTFNTVFSNNTIYSYNNPEPLPPSDPNTTITVYNVNQLLSAVNNLQSGWTISLAPGVYDMTGVADALYIPQGISNWAIRGESGNRDDAIIRGAGMNGSVRFGFWIGNSSNGTIADLTIDGIREHGIIANPGADDMLYHGLRLVDVGDQFIKSNPDANGQGNARGIVQYSIFEYRTTDTDDYTNGVDVHGGDGWKVRYNLFKNFLSPQGQYIAGPAVLFWNGSANTTVDGNTFINTARGISLGLINRANGFDHRGGSITNNMFYRDAGLASEIDVPIYVADSPDTKIYHNTVLDLGGYANAIEYRFASSVNIDIRNNLVNQAIVARDGATGNVSGNLNSATESMFRNPSVGDLHLLPTATTVIDVGNAINGLDLDLDGQRRDSQVDLGADEYMTTWTLSSLSLPGMYNFPYDSIYDYAKQVLNDSSTNFSVVTSLASLSANSSVYRLPPEESNQTENVGLPSLVGSKMAEGSGLNSEFDRPFDSPIKGLATDARHNDRHSAIDELMSEKLDPLTFWQEI